MKLNSVSDNTAAIQFCLLPECIVRTKHDSLQIREPQYTVSLDAESLLLSMVSGRPGLHSRGTG